MRDFKSWRPETLDEFEGQCALKRELGVELSASKRLLKPLPSMFFSGPPGLGKTTLAGILAKERGSPVISLMGEGMTHESLTVTLVEDFYKLGARRGYDLQGHLVKPEEAIFPVLIVDECERLGKGLYELFHNLLEPDNAEGIPMFQARYPATGEIFRAWTPRFTTVFLTNYAGDIANKSPATLSRFKINRQFQWYTDDQAQRVVIRQAHANKISVSMEAVQVIAKRSNGMPRRICNILERATSYLGDTPETQLITIEVLNQLLSNMEIDEDGFDPPMREYLQLLRDAPGGRLSLQSMASMLGLDTRTVELLIEPILLKNRLVVRGTGGRLITETGRSMLGRTQKQFDVYKSVKL